MLRATYTKVIRPTVVNSFYGGYNGLASDKAVLAAVHGWKAKGVCMAGVIDCDQTLPTITYSDYPTWGGSAGDGAENYLYSAGDDLTVTHGRHTLKFGFLWERLDFNGNFHTAFVRQRLHEVRAIGNRFGKIERLSLQNLLSSIEPRQCQQRLDQFPHPLRRALAGLDGLLVTQGIAFAVQRGLRLRQDYRNGRPQLMRGVGRKLFLLRESRFQSCESGIQNCRELAEFAFRLGNIDALRQIAGGNFHRRCADFIDRLDGARNQPSATDQTKKQNYATNARQFQGSQTKFPQFRRDCATDLNYFT